jgi:RND family efflux transporter MFP subunit
MKPTTLLTLLILIWLTQACSNSEGKTETTSIATEVIPVKVIPLTKKESSPLIQTSGVFTTDDETMLSFKTGGIIEKMYVKEGDAIRKGQLLATLNLTEINAQVAQAKLAFEKATRDFSRVENLYKDSVATLEQYQNVKTGMDVAQKQLDAANFNRSYSEIRALQNGFVLRKMANEGQVITSGTSVFQTNGASENKWKLRVGVSDREWASVSLGNQATITTDALPGKSYEATVTRKSEGTDAMSGAFTIELTLKNLVPALANGLFGKARIQTTRSQNVWSIPYDALLDGDAQTGYVFTTNDSKTAQKTPVVVSSIEREQVIISSGLENAQFLIVSGGAYLRDGSEIKVIK